MKKLSWDSLCRSLCKRRHCDRTCRRRLVCRVFVLGVYYPSQRGHRKPGGLTPTPSWLLAGRSSEVTSSGKSFNAARTSRAVGVSPLDIDSNKLSNAAAIVWPHKNLSSLVSSQGGTVLFCSLTPQSPGVAHNADAIPRDNRINNAGRGGKH